MDKKERQSLEDIPIVSSSKKIQVKTFDPEVKLKDTSFIAKALLEAFLDDDKEATIEILGAYLKTMEKRVLVKHTPRTT